MRLFLLPFLGLFTAQLSQAQDLTSRGLMTPSRLLPSGQEAGGQPYQSPHTAQPARNSSAGPTTLTDPSSSHMLPYWTRGTVLPYSGPAEHPWLKYDLVFNKLVSRLPSGESSQVDLDNIKEFSLGDSLLRTQRTYRRYLNARIENPALRLAFFEVRYDAGRAALLCRRSVSEVSDNSQRGRNSALRQRVVTTYFIKTPDNNLALVTLAEPAVLAALGPTHAAPMAAYIHRKRLKLTDEADVVELLAYYDTL
ncbi:hypothetical protein I2I05_20110 [Hymenobacter sp. BT683]|uniref:Uncharacterized protein n=1 Tax=Hymenobacter jeongseonensis TaxID=2791027 RepID=A0ABS0IP81_9BACT|nr:hypothetical protein [Hymenobacter jeongseonensis]MBF9239708.1 hypothetical protein [Hymenobacter jeongseonensis]